MESLGHEVVPFEDVVCQMWDMLKLGDRTYVTLQVSPLSRSATFALNSRYLTYVCTFTWHPEFTEVDILLVK